MQQWIEGHLPATRPSSSSANSNFTSESGLQYNEIHNNDEYPAFKAAIAYNGASTPTGCSAWFLASGYQWKQMANAVGGYNKLGLNQGHYWSSSEGSEQNAWYFHSSDGEWSNNSKEYYNLVRSCLAF